MIWPHLFVIFNIIWLLFKLVTKYGQHFYKHDLKIEKQNVTGITCNACHTEIMKIGVPLRSPIFFIGSRIQYKIIQLFNDSVACAFKKSEFFYLKYIFSPMPPKASVLFPPSCQNDKKGENTPSCYHGWGQRSSQ